MNSIATHAPGRAELLGNHTDYNEGYVLAIAVEGGTTLTGTTRDDGVLALRSRDLDKSVEIPLDQLTAEKVDEWARYTLGVVDVFRRHHMAVGGFSAEITSTLPMGAGLSSSASLENAAGLFLLKAFGGSLPPLQIARYSQMAEHDFVGVRCGLLGPDRLAHEPRRPCDLHRLPQLGHPASAALGSRQFRARPVGRETCAGRRRVQRAPL